MMQRINLAYGITIVIMASSALCCMLQYIYCVLFTGKLGIFRLKILVLAVKYGQNV